MYVNLWALLFLLVLAFLAGVWFGPKLRALLSKTAG